MDNYKVKVKKLNRSAFSTIMVWLEDPADQTFNADNIRQQLLTLAWIANHEGLQRRLNISGRDSEKLIKGMFNKFKEDFSDVVINLYQVTSVEQVLNMLSLIAKFIEDCIQENNKQLG
ncbi:hypothetical protein [Pedobacter hartonius]|uniref:Uncharacterized protein n=1 Tax=Pedobacter hartonius TaxID=425514 RepID=A0A1H4HA55_9SPHI|nr:hypothetical protein [Pedobacter hartonius]SEB18280.1 hypothetical protein SAMN05443550_11486 [Pedobacter hartonius]